MEVFEDYVLDKNVGAVVFGLDTEFTYSKLAIASLYVNELNCKLVATNDDVCMIVNGRKYPSAGTILSSLLVSIKDKSKLELVGKPNPFCL
jgi:phosphoglycolate phosphatase